MASGWPYRGRLFFQSKPFILQKVENHDSLSFYLWSITILDYSILTLNGYCAMMCTKMFNEGKLKCHKEVLLEF